MTIAVKENEDGTFTISWDPEDPEESIFNDWTESDFIAIITEYYKKTLENADLYPDQ